MAARKLILAIDQGTTSSRAIIFDGAGSPVGVCQKEHRQYFPAPAWVEHDAEEIWARVSECITGALAAAGATPTEISAVGITNQRETVVVWDPATGAPLYHALVWQDQRGAPLCEALAAEGGRDRYRHKTGLPLVPYFTASKLRWLLDNVDGLRARAEAGTAIAGTIDSFLLWRLTGRHETDVTNASRTLLANIHTLDWDDELCAAFKVPRMMLPTIRPSSHVYGPCLPSSPLPGVLVAGILGDQQSALFGQACFSAGDAKNTYGTGCFLLLNTGAEAVASHHGLLTTVAYQLAGQPPVYALEGSVAVAGAVVSWLRDALGLISRPADVEPLALSVPDNGGLVFVPAFNGLFAPHWRSDARGIIAGLSGSTHRGHLMRAALESVGFQCRELLEAMNKDARHALGGAPGSAGRAALRSAPLRVDGGMTANATLMQFTADVTGRAIIRPAVTETTALGAAYAAGLAVGVWRDTDALRAQWRESARWEPVMSPDVAHALIRRWDAAVTRSLGWSTLGKAEGGHEPSATAAAAAAAAPLKSATAAAVAVEAGGDTSSPTAAMVAAASAGGPEGRTARGALKGHAATGSTHRRLIGGGGGGGRMLRAGGLVLSGVVLGVIIGQQQLLPRGEGRQGMA